MQENFIIHSVYFKILEDSDMELVGGFQNIDFKMVMLAHIWSELYKF